MELKKIKVCHVVNGLLSGGVETVIYNYCSRMDFNKYEFHILYQHEVSEKNKKEFEDIGFILHEIPHKVKHPIKNFVQTYNYFKDNQIDIVHCHMNVVNFIPLIAAKMLKIKKRICHSHLYYMNKNIFVRTMYRFFNFLSIKSATDFVACGRDAGNYMFKKRKYTILRNAIDLNKFKYNPETRKKIRNKYNIYDDEIVLGHVGRFVTQKNHQFLVDLMNRLKNQNKKYKLILIGDGNLKPKIEELIKKDELENDVIFTGIINNANEYYSAFDIFLLPSFMEGFPCVAVEAQASGIKCVLSDAIDKTIEIIPSKVSRLPLNENIWIDEITKVEKYNRTINNEYLDNSGLSIDVEYKKLEKIYEI